MENSSGLIPVYKKIYTRRINNIEIDPNDSKLWIKMWLMIEK